MKGQSSIEFLALISLSALILAGMYGVMVAKQNQANEYQNREIAKRVAEKVSFQTEIALVQGDGYSRVFSLPDAIGGRSYNISIKDRSTVLVWGNNSLSQPTLYDQEPVNFSTRNTNVFRILNRDGEVNLVEE